MLTTDHIKFSIITVSFNSAATIERTILSVLNQNYSNIEYIIIDGNSKDGTKQIIESYKTKLAYYISEPDAGIYDAMNKGISKATGDWIGILNSDDWYELDAIKNIFEFIANQTCECEIIHGNMLLHFSSGESIKQLPSSSLDDLLQTMTLNHPTVFIKKCIYEKFGLFNCRYKVCSDWDLLRRFYTKRVNFLYLNKTIANFSEGGASSGWSWVHTKERFLIRHSSKKLQFFWYDFKDIVIWFYLEGKRLWKK